MFMPDIFLVNVLVSISHELLMVPCWRLKLVLKDGVLEPVMLPGPPIEPMFPTDAMLPILQLGLIEVVDRGGTTVESVRKPPTDST